MIYILTEDEGSGFKFFETLCNKLLEPGTFCVNSSQGNQNLDSKFNELSDLMRKGDKLLVAADSIEPTKMFSWFSFLETVEDFCLNNNVEFRYTTYYCFEEIFLSAVRLFQLSNTSVRAEKWREIISYIYSSICECENCYNLQNDFVKKVIYKVPYAADNKENFYKAVLSQVSRLFDGDYRITDRDLGTCWLESCTDAKLPDDGYRCPGCSDPLHNASSLEKIDDICNNSVFKEVNIINFFSHKL